MAELTLRSKDPDSLRRIIQSALSERLQSVKAGIKKTEERIQEFETKYQLSLTGWQVSLMVDTVIILDNKLNNNSIKKECDFEFGR